MHHRLAAVAALGCSIVVCSGVGAQSQNPPPGQRAVRAEVQENLPTPIREFSDAAGHWHGMVGLKRRVVMYVAPDGMVKFYGPNDVAQQATIRNQRLQVQSRNTDLDCGLMNGFLTCHARFDTWYAELNLKKQ